MPSADALAATVSRRDDALAFDGVLLRPVVASVWRAALPLLAGTRRIDIDQVARIDSAGLAMLAALARRAGIEIIEGMPAGYAELRAAYRLDASLGCAAG